MLFAMLAGVFLEPAISLWGVTLTVVVLLWRVLWKTALFRHAAVQGCHDLRSAGSGSRLQFAPVRQSLVAVALATSLVISESSPLNRSLLTIVVFIGLLSELLPFLTRRSQIQLPRSGLWLDDQTRPSEDATSTPDTS